MNRTSYVLKNLDRSYLPFVVSRRSEHSFGKLQGILNNMKVQNENKLSNEINSLGNSDLFNYATNKNYDSKDIKNQDLETWCKLKRHDTVNACLKTPLNGFEELIRLTEQGRLWRYPIDNEQGMEEEQSVPFEDHVFLDNYLNEFPDKEYIRDFMSLVVSGLGKNHWMTVKRKREIIQSYKEYFEQKREIYKLSGLEI